MAKRGDTKRAGPAAPPKLRGHSHNIYYGTILCHARGKVAPQSICRTSLLLRRYRAKGLRLCRNELPEPRD